MNGCLKALAVVVGGTIAIEVWDGLSLDVDASPVGLVLLIAAVYGAVSAAAVYAVSFKDVREKHRRSGKAGR